MALKTAVAPCAPMREEKQPGGSPHDPANGTAAAVYQFATPQCVRRTLPELSRSRGFKQAKSKRPNCLRPREWLSFLGGLPNTSKGYIYVPVPPLAVQGGPFCLLFRPNGKGGASAA